MPIRFLIAILACAAAVPADEPEAKYTALIQRLCGKKPSERETARKALLHHGSPALPALRGALEAARTEAQRTAIREVITAIEKREPHGIRFEVGLPKLPLDLAEVNRDAFRYTIRLRNGGDEPVVLWPFFGLRVLDAKGHEVATTLSQGRWGLGRSPRYLELIEFIEIPPGESRSIPAGLARYLRDPELVLGWKIPRAGEYTLEFTYDFDRAAVKKNCDPAWKALDDPAKPWNRALAVKHVFTATLKVTERDPK
jgi:hypothetical protein